MTCIKLGDAAVCDQNDIVFASACEKIEAVDPRGLKSVRPLLEVHERQCLYVPDPFNRCDQDKSFQHDSERRAEEQRRQAVRACRV